MDENTLSKSGRRVFGCFGLAFGSLFLVVGLGFMLTIAYRGLAQRNTEDWSKTEGEVLEVNTQRDEDDPRSSPLTYKYTVDDKIYRSDTVVFVDAENLEYDDWLGLADGIAEIGAVDVYYDPANHSDSVLRPGDAPESWNGLGFGGLFAGFAAFWMAAWWGMTNWLPDKLGSFQTQGGE